MVDNKPRELQQYRVGNIAHVPRGEDARSRRRKLCGLEKSRRRYRTVHDLNVPVIECKSSKKTGKCKHTLRIWSIRSQHLSNALLMSRETVIGDGIVVPGRPAFISTAKAQSLTILSGRLLSAHHLAIWALSKLCLSQSWEMAEAC